MIFKLFKRKEYMDYDDYKLLLEQKEMVKFIDSTSKRSIKNLS